MCKNQCKDKAAKVVSEHTSFVLIAGSEVDGEPGHVTGSTLRHVEGPIAQATIACRAIQQGIEMHEELLNDCKKHAMPKNLEKEVTAVLGTLRLAFERFLHTTGLDEAMDKRNEVDALMKEGKIVPITMKKGTPNLN